MYCARGQKQAGLLDRFWRGRFTSNLQTHKLLCLSLTYSLEFYSVIFYYNNLFI